MADTTTTNVSLTKPEVGASSDTWGTKLNANFDTLDSLFTTGPALLVSKGGTGATTASGARTNLGVSASGVLTSSWTVTESGGTLYFAYSGTNKAKLDSSGNLTVVGNVTAYGTV